ncbi:unnamed protein product [Linum tenue]|uniref:Uncharacterized protein n=1 Tax=Linum tenue TaxID=586396 RepID=A0AAV0K5B2_9ROSI|nr:unnamed protein product [Linum tenue]
MIIHRGLGCAKPWCSTLEGHLTAIRPIGSCTSIASTMTNIITTPSFR